MLLSEKKRITVLILIIALVVFFELWFTAVSVNAGVQPIPEVKQGCNYKLMKITRVYKGPGKEYGCVMRKSLKPSTRKHAVANSKQAKLKKGTIVSCLKVKKHWMKIPSGWIHIDKNSVKLYKKHRA